MSAVARPSMPLAGRSGRPSFIWRTDPSVVDAAVTSPAAKLPSRSAVTVFDLPRHGLDGADPGPERPVATPCWIVPNTAG